MTWDDVCAELSAVECSLADCSITGVQYDSRRVTDGDIFVAMHGEATDGNLYTEAAIARGAAAVITDSRESYEKMRREHPGIGAALVQKGRRALAKVSSTVMEHPERKLALSAVTGTNGKTTTSFLLEAMLKSAGRRCVLIGTIETHVGDEVRVSFHTTPESRDLLATFADGVKAGATEAVMEMSSHALDQERVWGLPVDVAIFTNLTQDHLDYHGTMAAYGAAKARLFEGLGAPPPRVAVVNLDDEYGATMVSMASGCDEVWTYGLAGGRNSSSQFRAENVTLGAEKTSFEWKTPMGTVTLHSSLTGQVNVYNLLAASCAAMARGLSLDQIAEITRQLQPVPGRFETISNTIGLMVVVDYAHTEDALRNLIAIARGLLKKPGGKVITMFGCGGDRDRTKRARMGRAAGEGSDLIVLTSDNPRSEDPMMIIEEVLAGVRETDVACIVEADRAGAIEIAIRAARVGDIVLLAGKGHEKVQVLQDCTVPFDDVAVAAGVLKELT